MRGILAAALFGLALVTIARAEQWPELDAVAIASLQLGTRPARGTPEKLRVVEVTDFGCPACAKAHPVVEELIALYGDRLEFHFYAIAGPSHPWSREAYAAARCLAEEDPEHFWKAASHFYENAREIDIQSVDESVGEIAEELDVDDDAFAACYSGQRYREEIDANLKAILQAGIRSTPTFIIGTKVVPGVRPLDEMRAIIDEALDEGESFWDWLP